MLLLLCGPHFEYKALETVDGLVWGEQSGDLERGKIFKMIAPGTEFSDESLGMSKQESSRFVN